MKNDYEIGLGCVLVIGDIIGLIVLFVLFSSARNNAEWIVLAHVACWPLLLWYFSKNKKKNNHEED